MANYGFIITRHVNSITTNHYWNNCVKLIRTFYPDKQIVIIDDNSNYDYVNPDFDYKNVQIIKSDFPGRGELLPYYYLLKYKFFENAVIIHDSIFIHKRINFENLKGVNVLPLWFFNPDKENVENTKRIAKSLKNSYIIENKIAMDTNILGIKTDKWFGCFGVQSFINLHFLEQIEYKYRITNMISQVKCRKDRCSLERIFGAIFYTESPHLFKQQSLLGNILTYCKWGYTYDEYAKDVTANRLPKNIIKVWTGR